MNEANKQTNDKTLCIMDVLFVLDQYIDDDNLHAIALYPVASSFSLSRDRLEVIRHPRCSLYLMRFGIPVFTIVAFSVQLENSLKQITQLFFVKNSRIHATHIILFSSNHFRLKRNFNILLEYPINVKFFIFNKKMYNILSIAL